MLPLMTGEQTGTCIYNELLKATEICMVRSRAVFAEDNVTAQVRYRAMEQNTDGDANDC